MLVGSPGLEGVQPPEEVGSPEGVGQEPVIEWINKLKHDR